MRRGDIEGLIRLLDYEVEVATDIVVPREKLAHDLRKHTGRTYAFLFDTGWLRKDAEEWRKQLTAEQREQMPPIESVRSVRDLLVNAKDLETSVCFVSETREKKKPLIVVGFDWPDRPALRQLPNSMFVLTGKGWKTSMLFSVPVWQ